MQYIHGEWNHLFKSAPARDATCRILVDWSNETLVAGEISTRSEDGAPTAWRSMRASEKADVLDSLKQGNAEVFDNPKDYGFKVSYTPPDWALAALKPKVIEPSVDSGYSLS